MHDKINSNCPPHVARVTSFFFTTIFAFSLSIFIKYYPRITAKFIDKLWRLRSLQFRFVHEYCSFSDFKMLWRFTRETCIIPESVLMTRPLANVTVKTSRTRSKLSWYWEAHFSASTAAATEVYTLKPCLYAPPLQLVLLRIWVRHYLSIYCYGYV